jgi:hypothetical protein
MHKGCCTCGTAVGVLAVLAHSCSASTAAGVSVLAGKEPSCSYLGQRGLAPVGLRRAYLQGVYGFHCQVSCLLLLCLCFALLLAVDAW